MVEGKQERESTVIEQPIQSPLVPRSEAILLLGVSDSTERRLRAEDPDWVPHIRIGRKVYYRREDLMQWLNQRHSAPKHYRPAPDQAALDRHIERAQRFFGIRKGFRIAQDYLWDRSQEVSGWGSRRKIFRAASQELDDLIADQAKILGIKEEEGTRSPAFWETFGDGVLHGLQMVIKHLDDISPDYPHRHRRLLSKLRTDLVEMKQRVLEEGR